MTNANFQSIPTLDYSLAAHPDSRAKFVAQLQDVIVNIGFLYLENTPIDKDIVSKLKAQIPHLFALPQKEKDKLRMANSPHFLGYSRLGAELTKGTVDHREQFDFGTPCESTFKLGDPEYWNIYGPSQYPSEELLPGFRSLMETYLTQLQALASDFLRLISEALGLLPDTLDQFYSSDNRMHLSKIVQYPVQPNSQQGVGAHYDSAMLLQASEEHRGLQAQNFRGDWIDVPPKPDTFVINFGRSLEFVTQGVVRATSHRVLAPSLDSKTPRYSVPVDENVLTMPAEILKLRDERGPLPVTESINFSEYAHDVAGKVYLVGRAKSHPDVAERHYPDLFKQLFPDGMPLHGVAY
ncbi:Clavaminate synthase-like protein [Gymnopus androsaceus JB14]|uniref:Clavaminate synthase-like protein n=1 Tax=Gymnopus androsaceus JB14 TaxID=1447944 RepID=A0A6A4HZP7_9AGAR|nr:Clavaminate synthase-like protein [Gymnopus androsaceus JB14]